MKKLLVKLFNKETITYVIFGGLTTVVNYAVYYLFYKFTTVDPVVYNSMGRCGAFCIHNQQAFCI